MDSRAMTLKEQIESDVASVFFNTDEFAEAISYLRAADAPIPTTGILNEKQVRIEDDEGFATKATVMFWQIQVADLPYKPRNGDRIQRADGEVYEVMPYARSDDAVHKDDSGHVWMLQTKRTK